MSIGEALRREHRLPRWIWRSVATVGAVVVVALLADVVAGLFFGSRIRETLNEAFEPVRPPADGVMCDSGPTPACAADAAAAADATVAWMPAPDGYRLRWLVAGGDEGRGIAFEYLTSETVALELHSGWTSVRPLDADAHVAATFDVDGTRVVAWIPDDDTVPEVTLVWTRGREEFRLFVFPTSPLDTSPIDPASFANLVASVRYAQPR